MTLKDKICLLIPVLGAKKIELAIAACGPAANLPIDSPEDRQAHGRLADRCDPATQGRMLHVAIEKIIATPIDNLLVDRRSVLSGLELAYLGSIGHKYEADDGKRISIDTFAALSIESDSLVAQGQP